ncbi:hypothetical protein ACFQ1S_39440, partial [Kibdelosporangium lantanae]
MSRTTSRREQYSQATKAALLEAATRRFAEHGFSGTALEDVAKPLTADSNGPTRFNTMLDENPPATYRP